MATVEEYMQFALGVYNASDENKIGVPTGWRMIDWQTDKWTSGFSAGAFYHAMSNEIVISYTGTNGPLDMLNWSAGVSLPVPQIFEAIAYYLSFNIQE